MNWNEALALIQQHITVGLHLNPASQFRHIIEGPNYICNTYDYNGALGYRIQIGENMFVEIPVSMLDVLFHSAQQNDNIYNNLVFQNNYPRQFNNHDCYVHVVGKIFTIAGVANQNGNNFEIQ